jgi:hypothetical protein
MSMPSSASSEFSLPQWVHQWLPILAPSPILLQYLYLTWDSFHICWGIPLQ